MIGIAKSRNGVPIRLTEERWYHIVENHEDLAGYTNEVLATVENPDFIASGWIDELLAVREIEDGKYMVVVYKEVSPNDGFIITAYFTRKIKKIKRRNIRWPR